MKFAKFSSAQICWSQASDGNMKNATNLAKSLASLPPPTSTWLTLYHGADVQIATVQDAHLDGDAIITSDPRHLIGFVVGDCFPVVIADPDKKVAALLHCGWKSLYKGIIPKTVEVLKEKFHSQSQDLAIWIGPGICEQHYTHAETPAQTDEPAWQRFISKKDDHYSVDLAGFIKESFERLGITKITDSQLCTFDHENNLFSHHRSIKTGEHDGRFLVGVWFGT